MSPELLPAVVTVMLARGTREMARAGVLVRRLDAIEDLGAIDVLCTDKTGTLTEARITLHAALDAAASPSEDVLRLGCLEATLETASYGALATPIDEALKAVAATRPQALQGWRRLGEVPYDFERKRASVLAADARRSAALLVTKGTLRSTLAACATVRERGVAVALDEQRRARLQEVEQRLGEQGLRVLAVATREIETPPVPLGRDDERAMCFEGFLAFADPPKADACAAIDALEALGIELKIVSSDSRSVTSELARRVGLDAATVLTGGEITAMSDAALARRARRTRLFVEVVPQQKERIVRALRRGGSVVGYLGDGINDVPALQAADVGISVDQAVDAARESADLVLLRHDLRVLSQGVAEGRRVFANTLKYIGISTSANFSNMVSMAASAGLLPFLPLAAKQILLNNLLSDIPAMAVAADRADAAQLAQPQRWDRRRMLRFMVGFGLLATAFDLLCFAVLLHVFHAAEPVFQTAWFVVSLLTELAMLIVLRTETLSWRSPPVPLLGGSCALVALLALAMPYAGAGAALFGFVALPAVMIVAQLTLVVAYALATEALKRAAGQRLRLTGAARAARRPAHAAVRRRRAGP